jgi:predicted unusual protein kinase regulating ubiquinone biosynthesis (AarF/ABC1/UbiB family)
LLNELANGDLKTFIPLNYLNNDLLINTIQQIYISILSFHKKTGFIHFDAHWGNFLYHKIKPGGYFHYYIKDLNKNFYIENKGYLWIIWDYGFAKKIEPNKEKSVLVDYYRINPSICNENNRGWVDNKYKINNSILKLKQTLDNLYISAKNENELWIQLEKYLFTDKYIPHKNEIINSVPFYL